MRTILIAAASSFLLLVVGGVLLATGTFEQFGSPIRIVIPEGFSGVACGRHREGEERGLATWMVDSRGYFESGGERGSHRPREVLIRDKSSGALKSTAVDLWHPIFTEGDTHTGQTYTVVWVGPVEGWDKAKNAESFCIHRFK